MKKTLARVFGTFLAALMTVQSCPLGVFAQELQDEEEFRRELETSVSAEEYPDGVFDFLSSRMKTGEGMGFVEFAVVRRGNTEKEASVRFKAIDMSAEYGADYTITVPDGLLRSEIEKNEDAPLYIQSVTVESQTPAEEGEEAPTEEYAETAEAREDENAGDAEAELFDEPFDGSLVSAVRKQTGKDYRLKDWRSEDAAVLEALDEAAKEMYDDIAGHETTLVFAPGEYKKILRFYTVDDKISEDEEQVLFVLSHAENCDLVPNPTGFMDIVDNEEPEKVTYRFKAPLYDVPSHAGSVTVEIERLTGLYRYDKMTVFSGEGTAQVGKNYDSQCLDVMFLPGNKVKTVEIPIKEHPLAEAVDFRLYTDDFSEFTVINIEPVIANGAIYTETEPVYEENGDSESAALLSVPSRTASYDLLSSGFKRTTGGSYFAYDQLIELNNTWISFSGIDLTMVKSISFTHGENGAGTSYTYKSGCDKKTGWHTTKYNAIEIDGQSAGNNVKRYGTFENVTETVKLDQSARKANGTITFKSLGEDGCNATHGYLNRYIRVEYEPFFIDTGSADRKDSVICPVVYENPDRYSPRKITVDGKEKNYEFAAGTICLAGGKTHDTFFSNSTIEVEPVWDPNLTEDERNSIYLWGVKFEKASSGRETEYYYYKGTSFNLETLYKKGYKDYYTGKTIGADCILTDSGTRGYKILPVFRQRTAYTRIETMADEMYEPGTLKNSDVLVTGRLDEIHVKTNLYDDQMVAGWNAYYDEPSPSDARERSMYASEELRQNKPSEYESIKASGASTIETKLRTQWSGGLGTSKQLNYGEAYPGEMLFHPNGMFNYVVATYQKPSITVSVNPRPANYTDQKAGQVLYYDEKTGDQQLADYTGKSGSYATGNKIVVSPYSLVPYNFTAITDQPPEGYTYKISWVDYTGDTDGDGELSEAELKALGSTGNAVYGDYRRVYAGNVFSYTPKIIGESKVYYQLRKVSASDADPDAPKRSLKGTVVLRSRTVLDNTSGAGYTMLPVAGAVVRAGDLSCVTDENGRWEISSENFEGDEIHAVNVSYGGRIYSFNVTVGQYALEMPIQEYDTFNVTDFVIKNGSKTVAPDTLTAEDARHRYSFRITSMVPGVSAEKVEVYRFSKNDTLQAVYEAFMDRAKGEWVIRNEKSKAAFESGDSDYSFNPLGETPPVGAGDYLVIHITDNNGVSYIPHDVGVRYKAHLGMISVVNTLIPKSGVVLDYIDKVGCSFDLGFSTTLDSGLRDGLEAAGVKFEEKTKDGVYTEIISWGWSSKVVSEKYKPKDKDKDKEKEEEKKEEGEEEKEPEEPGTTDDDDGGDEPSDEPENEDNASLSALRAGQEIELSDLSDEEAAKEIIREDASGLDTVSEKAENEMTEEEKAEAEENGDREKKAEASEDAKNAVDKDKNKKRSEFAANISVDLSVAVSLELAYDEEADAWYFVEFLVVGTVKAAASASYSYMTPIGVKIGIKATLSGDITAMFGYSEYVRDPMHPEHTYISETGGLDVGSMGNRDINRKMNVYGKLMIRPTVTLGISAALISDNIASVSLVGSAAFDMNFTTAKTGSGNVTLAANLELSLLFGLIKKKWSLAKKTYSMFEYASEPELFDLMGDGTDLRYETITAEDIDDAPKDPVSWNGDMSAGAERSSDALLSELVGSAAYTVSEHILAEEFDSEAMPKLERIREHWFAEPGNKDAILIFLDAKEAGSPIRVLKYSFLVGEEWTAPVAFDPDSMGDDSHNIEYIGDDKIIISWSTNVDSELIDDPKERLNHRKLRTVIYDIATDSFGEIRELTKVTEGDIYADSGADFAYWKNGEGKEFLVAAYRKTIFENVGADSGEDAALMVGDVLNATTYMAYRFYNFEKDDWYTGYEAGYLDFLETEEEKAAYTENMYGQYFVDLAGYITTVPAINAERVVDGIPQCFDSRNMGVWSRLPEKEDVMLASIDTDYQVVSQDAAAYDGKAVFVYLVDFDGDESSTEDRELLMMVYDFEKDELAPPLRLTYNDFIENNIILTDMQDGLRLYYSEDGSIVCLKLSDIIDNAVEIPDFPYAGVLCTALLENRLPQNCIDRTVILAKKAADEESPEEVRYESFSMDWTDGTEYLFFTEPAISYADGISAEDPEAALPENQFFERHLYMLFHSVIAYTTELTEEDGSVMLYPEFDSAGNPIDYTKVPDALGNVGEVKAGDPVLVEVYEEERLPKIQLTEGKGENILFADSIFDGRYISAVYVRAESELCEVDGVMVPRASEEGRKLVLAQFDPYTIENFSYHLDVTADNLDDIVYAGDTFDLELTLTNPTFVESDIIVAAVSQNDGTGNYVPCGEASTGRVGTGETRRLTVPITLPEDLRDLDLRIRVFDRFILFDEYEEETLATLEYSYTQPADVMKIREIRKTVLDRNKVLYEITVENPSGVTLEDEKLGVGIGERMVYSEDFDLAPGETKRIGIELDVNDEDFVEERTETMIFERAAVTVYSESESVEDVIERRGRLEYEEMLDGVQLIDRITGDGIGEALLMDADSYVIPCAASGERDDLMQAIMLAAESEDADVASVDAKGGIRAEGEGETEITIHAAPNVTGYLGLLEDSTDVELYNDYNLLPSALVKDITVKVVVADDEPGGGTIVYPTGRGSGKTPVVKKPEPEPVPEEKDKALKFSDTPVDAWYYDAVQYVFEKGLMKGVSSDRFDPDGDVTRAMFVTVIYRLEGEPETGLTDKFVDVADDAYYAKAVAWAEKAGIVKGTSHTEFSPDDNITREQMAAILYRYAQFKNLPVDTAFPEGKTFGDLGTVSDWAKDAVYYCINAGLLKGDGNGNINPLAPASRAEFASILTRW